MPSVITNHNTTSLSMGHVEYRQVTVSSIGVDTYLCGSIMSRKSISDTIVITPEVSNTGDGVFTAALVAGSTSIPVAGDYTLLCVSTIANGGVFNLFNSNVELMGQLSYSSDTTINIAGFAVSFVDGAADFIVGDSITLTVAADNSVVPYSLTGAGGAQLPIFVLPNDIEFTAAGDRGQKILVSGVVRFSKLLIHADGDNSNIDETIKDKLGAHSIIVVNTTELTAINN